jgi:hypothetical protein
MTLTGRAMRNRVAVASILFLLAAVLFVWHWNAVEHPPQTLATDKIRRIDDAIDGVMARYGIEPSRIRKWQVKSAGGSFSRIERKVSVPPDLVIVELNRDLQDALIPLDARVSGTERTKERAVILHIVAEEQTIQTITLVPEEQKQRKGQ